jgi:hypothetical protein
LALLKLLVSVLADADPANPATFITYTEVHKQLKLPLLFGNAGRSLQSQGLDSLATWTKNQGVPAITGLVVREHERDPGPGYFRANGKREVEDLHWWLDEMKRAKETDWGSYLSVSNAIATSSASSLTIASVAQPASRFFLKSEYGPVSSEWPVVAFSAKAVGSKLQNEFNPDVDFIVYTGTGGSATLDPAHRGRLLSVLRVDTSEMLQTKEEISESNWQWAQTAYPGQWECCFRAGEAWQISDLPRSTDIVSDSYSKMGLYPNRGNVLEITGADRTALLKLRLSSISLVNPTGNESSKGQAPKMDEKQLLDEAKRIANLIYARVAVSGNTLERTAPERTAPDGLVLAVRDLLRVTPLACYLCGGLMEIAPQNKLLQPSPDRIDSGLGDYGPLNLKLAHLACNLGKNAASVAEYHEWLKIMRGN